MVASRSAMGCSPTPRNALSASLRYWTVPFADFSAAWVAVSSTASFSIGSDTSFRTCFTCASAALSCTTVKVSSPSEGAIRRRRSSRALADRPSIALVRAAPAPWMSRMAFSRDASSACRAALAAASSAIDEKLHHFCNAFRTSLFSSSATTS